MGTLRLPVALTDADRLSIGAEMSAAQTALEAVEAEKKAEMKEYNEAIKGHKHTIHERNSVLKSGVIMRDVEVETREEPRLWFERSDDDGAQTACSRECIDVIAKKTGKTGVVLPL